MKHVGCSYTLGAECRTEIIAVVGHGNKAYILPWDSTFYC